MTDALVAAFKELGVTPENIAGLVAKEIMGAGIPQKVQVTPAEAAWALGFTERAFEQSGAKIAASRYKVKWGTWVNGISFWWHLRAQANRHQHQPGTWGTTQRFDRTNGGSRVGIRSVARGTGNKRGVSGMALGAYHSMTGPSRDDREDARWCEA
jgi:hypothetical protein